MVNSQMMNKLGAHAKQRGLHLHNGNSDYMITHRSTKGKDFTLKTSHSMTV